MHNQGQCALQLSYCQHRFTDASQQVLSTRNLSVAGGTRVTKGISVDKTPLSIGFMSSKRICSISQLQLL